ncbi:MAG: hypothetical protein IKH39_08870 [Candidatus Methanomethylophilaceae archaeon]|nr:hypothetical protein [Candidatus Methanomethylophilaceae archaeon]
MSTYNTDSNASADGGKRMSDLKVCNRCQYAWFSNVESPVRCPSCGSHCWDKPSVPNVCQICGHKWFPRTDGMPLRCPSCKTRSWNVNDASVYSKVGRTFRESVAVSAVMEKYLAGKGCLKISMETGMPLSTVFDIVKANVGKTQVRM